MGRPAISLPRITFRLSPDLLERIEEAAKTGGRSLNAEIVGRLEASFGHSESAFNETQEEEIRRVATEIATQLMMKVEEKMRNNPA